MRRGVFLFLALATGCPLGGCLSTGASPELSKPCRPAASAAHGRGLLEPGQKLVLRVRQVIPCDGLSPGERLLNGRKLLVPTDRFLAEVLDGDQPTGILVGGMVTRVHPPGWFRRAGHVEVELVQAIQFQLGLTSPNPVRVDLDDRGAAGQAGRLLANLYAGLEVAGVGAAVGAQVAGGTSGYVLGGAGVGFLVGLGVAAFVHGPDASLEPGDTFEIEVGTCSYRPLPQNAPMTVYPPCVPPRK